MDERVGIGEGLEVVALSGRGIVVVAAREQDTGRVTGDGALMVLGRGAFAAHSRAASTSDQRHQRHMGSPRSWLKPQFEQSKTGLPSLSSSPRGNEGEVCIRGSAATREGGIHARLSARRSILEVGEPEQTRPDACCDAGY